MSYQRGPYGGGQLTLNFPPFTPMVRRILWTLGVAWVVMWFLMKLEMLRVLTLWSQLHALLALHPELRIVRPDTGAETMPVAVWQLLTYALLHDGPVHLLLNGLGIWMFGGDVERVLGSRGFLRFFVVCVVGGGLAVILGGLLTGSAAGVIGASGGVLGLVLAFALFFPERRVYVFPLPFPMPAWVLAAIYAVVNLLGALTPGGSKVSYAAHLGGLIAGYLYLKGFIKPGSWTRLFSRRRRSFRVIPGERDHYDA